MVELKYAVVERERRWLLAGPPTGMVGEVLAISDRYLVGTRLRLREVTHEDGSVVRKLGHKVRLGDTAMEIACTSLYLDDAEWDALGGLPTHRLRKRRTCVSHAGVVVAVDEYDGDLAGLVIAEIDTRDGPAVEPPGEWDLVAEVTLDERYTGAALAAAAGRP